MASNSLRRETLNLYKKNLYALVDLGMPPIRTIPDERNYILNETRHWFLVNKNVTNTQAIKDHLQEGEARQEMALHYKNPYPRPVNLPPKAFSVQQGKKHGIAQEKLRGQSRPVYVKSIDHESRIKSKT